MNDLSSNLSSNCVAKSKGVTFTATKGAAIKQAVATFTDPDDPTGKLEKATDYSATINWGDNTATTAGTLSTPDRHGVYTVTGSHTYAAKGTYAITVTIKHETAPTATASSVAKIVSAANLSAPDGTTTAFTPAQVRTAYGVNQLIVDGTGQTIALVEAYDNPSIYQSLDAFDAQFGATGSGPTLLDQYGAASALPQKFGRVRK